MQTGNQADASPEPRWKRKVERHRKPIRGLAPKLGTRWESGTTLFSI